MRPAKAARQAAPHIEAILRQTEKLTGGTRARVDRARSHRGTDGRRAARRVAGEAAEKATKVAPTSRAEADRRQLAYGVVWRTSEPSPLSMNTARRS